VLFFSYIRQMFKRITIICFMLVALGAKAQFEVESDTLYTTGAAALTKSDFVDVYADVDITSTNFNGEMIKWTRTVEQLPGAGWSSAVCDIVSCRGPEVDTGSFFFEANATGKLSFHFYPDTMAGNGKMVVKFYRESNPLDFIEVVIFAHIWHPVSISAKSIQINSLYPNPSVDFINVSVNEVENGTLSIYNAFGQLMLTQTFNLNAKIDVAELTAGVYSIEVSDAENKAVSKFIKK
jgi:hypothetical protein